MHLGCDFERHNRHAIIILTCSCEFDPVHDAPHLSINKFAESHYQSERPERISSVNAWKECECEIDGVWVSTYNLPGESVAVTRKYRHEAGITMHIMMNIRILQGILFRRVIFYNCAHVVSSFYAPQTKSFDDRTRGRACLFDGLGEGVSTRFGLRTIAKVTRKDTPTCGSC
jgi:hypothetical protein